VVPSGEGFAKFWEVYPNKVGKAAAAKAFLAALKRASFEDIMAGLQRYVVKTDDRPWCNPATWLNQDRWQDQPAPPVPRKSFFNDEQTELDARNRRYMEQLMEKAKNGQSI
jgi:hypothetical protein